MTRKQDRKIRPVCESLEGRQVLSPLVHPVPQAIPIVRVGHDHVPSFPQVVPTGQTRGHNDAARDITVSRRDDLGANHFMESHVTLRVGGHIDATTRTTTYTWFGGFTGGVSVLFYDDRGVVIGQSGEHAFGVDGTWTGRSDRTDYWSEDIAPELAARTSGLEILHYWAPKYKAIDNIVDHAVVVGEKVVPLIKQLKDAGLI